MCKESCLYRSDFAGVEASLLYARWVSSQIQALSGNHQTLERYIEQNLYNAPALHELCDQFVEMCESLRQANICHGDLQHGNIIVQPNGRLRLVDYDGMFVPTMCGLQSNELGHRNYQHPERSACHFGPALDTFAARVIYVSLCAIIEDPTIFSKVNRGNDCLLFTREDFEDVHQSRIFRTLDLMSKRIQDMSNALKWLVGSHPMTELGLTQNAPLTVRPLKEPSALCDDTAPWYASELPRASQSAKSLSVNSVSSLPCYEVERELVLADIPRQLVCSHGPYAYTNDALLCTLFWLPFFTCVLPYSEVASFFLLLAIGVAVILWKTDAERRVLQTGEIAKAIITDRLHTEEDDGDGGKRIVYKIKYSFLLQSSSPASRQITNEIRVPKEVYNLVVENQKVTVLYDQENPKKNFVYQFSRFRAQCN